MPVLGVLSVAQRWPFQRMTSDGLPDAWPRAYTLVAESAVTPNSRPPCEVGLGTATSLQLRPSQCTTNGTCHKVDSENFEPTAHTSLLDTTTTPSREASRPVGLGTMLHAVPFQCWISGSLTEYSPFCVWPTAQRSSEAAPSIALRWFSELGVSGVGTMPHALPFHRTAKVLKARLPGTLWLPTAQAWLLDSVLTPTR